MAPRPLTILASLLLLAAAAGAQVSVDPANRVLVIESGDSAKVTIDTGDCDPSWEAASDDTEVATVSPDAYENGKKRKFTVTALPEQLAGSATITIDLDDFECVAESSVQITAHVVGRSPKTLVKQFTKGSADDGVSGTKARLKALKGSLKDGEKALKTSHKTILDALKDGTLALDELAPPPPGGPTLLDHELALVEALEAESDLAEAIWDAWFLAAGGSASDGNDLLSAAGYLSADRDVTAAVTPPDLLRGTGGAWDDVTDTAWMSALATLVRGEQTARKFHGKVAKLTADRGVRIAGRVAPPLDIGPLLDGPSQLGFLPQTSPSLDTRPQLVVLRASNHHADGNANGRLYLLGRGPVLGTLDVTLQRLSAGVPEGDPIEEEVDLGFGTLWSLVVPGTGSAAGLDPGTWRVSVSDGTVEVSEVIDVPVL